MINNDIFENLFVLEMTNNHRGNLDRGEEIIKVHSKILKSNKVRGAIKVQLRQIDTFIHPTFLERNDIRYVRRVLDTRLSKDNYQKLIQTIIEEDCIPIATPFDEESVDWCMDFDLPIIKVASVDSSDWSLLKKILATRRPVIVSTAGAAQADVDELVTVFNERKIPLAINHCISIYPTENYDLMLDQIDVLKQRYPKIVIGFSAHDYNNIDLSMIIAYAKGARFFERHIDIMYNKDDTISLYSSLPEQIDLWIKAFWKAKEMCGNEKSEWRPTLKKEDLYLNSYIRGCYASKDIKKGERINSNTAYYAIPKQDGQLSVKDLKDNKVYIAQSDISKDNAILKANLALRSN